MTLIDILNLATAIINGATILLAVGYFVVWPAVRWIWTRYFWPPIECPRMLKELEARRK